MRPLVFCAFLIPLTCAGGEKRAIFRQGDFFDPFREKGNADNQPSASVVPKLSQPNVVFSPFKEANNKPAELVGYPRTIGRVSGNAKQFNAQLWHPNEFFTSFAKYQNPAVQQQQQQLVAAPFALPENQGAIYLKRVSGPRAQPRKFEELVTLQPQRLYSPKVLTAPTQVQAAPYKSAPTQSRHLTPKAPGVASAESSNVVEHASKLGPESSELEAYLDSHSVSNSAGSGKSHHSGHHQSHGDKKEKGYKSDHSRDKADHKKYLDHHKESRHKEKGANHNDHHDEAGHYKKHHEAKKSHKAAKFGEKKGHKRGHKTKGYHNKLHRDEYHREHRFYDAYNKEGYHEKHGDAHSHYKDEEGDHKDGGSRNSGNSAKHHGKKDSSDKENYEDEDKGFNKESGRKKYHKHHKEHHEKGGGAKGKKYGYNEEH